MAHRPMILLIDDSPLVRERLCAALTRHGGFRIGGVAADGRDGALLAAELEPEVVLLDVCLPRWDGDRAAEFIRARSPKTKIVALSSIVMESPEWADRFAIKSDVDEVVNLAAELAA